MAERYPKFSFLGCLDQAVCDLIEDGLEQRTEQRGSISSAPSKFREDLFEVDKFLAAWSDEPKALHRGAELLGKDLSGRR